MNISIQNTQTKQGKQFIKLNRDKFKTRRNSVFSLYAWNHSSLKNPLMLKQIESQFANYCMVQDNLICTKASIVPILQIKT
jgi:hypothetical protein